MTNSASAASSAASAASSASQSMEKRVGTGQWVASATDEEGRWPYYDGVHGGRAPTQEEAIARCNERAAYAAGPPRCNHPSCNSKKSARQHGGRYYHPTFARWVCTVCDRGKKL